MVNIFFFQHSRAASISIVILIVTAIDQLVKALIRSYLPLNSSINVIGNILSFTHISNTGAAFSLLHGMNGLLVVISLVVMAGFLFWYSQIASKNKNMFLPFGLIVGGAASNIIDRVTQGFVTDFIDFHFWPAFNIADSAITVGVAVLIFYELKKK